MRTLLAVLPLATLSAIGFAQEPARAPVRQPQLGTRGVPVLEQGASASGI